MIDIGEQSLNLSVNRFRPMIPTFLCFFSLYLEFRLSIERVETPSARHNLLR